MTREEAIKTLEESQRQNRIIRGSPTTFFKSADICEGVKNSERRIEALDMAIAALRSQQEGNVPLTLEELREMDGEPVWIVSLRLGDGCWNIADCHTNEGGLTAICESRYCPFWFWMEYGITWLAYRRKPEEGEA